MAKATPGKTKKTTAPRKRGTKTASAKSAAPRKTKTASKKKSTARKRAPAPKLMAPAASGSGPAIRIRMYRQGLGDCFLITFDHEGANPRHMLIDCGSLGATTTGVKLQVVAEHIASTTADPANQGGHLHLLVATHEHWDHVAGFGGNTEIFKKMKVDRVWMAWTENPDDPLAQQLAKSKADLGQSLAAALTAAEATGVASENAANVKDLLGFVMGPDESLPMAATDLSKKLNEAMDFVRTGLGVKAEYLNPGDLPNVDSWLSGFRFYILGPPRSAKVLGDLGAHGSGELYSLADGLRAAAIEHSRAARALFSPDECGLESESPFDNRFRATIKKGKTWFADYFDSEVEWRKIDHTWLTAASDLALQLDSITNNSSLAMAIERVADGKVFLFPADAQQGNWLSWHDDNMKWKTRFAGGPLRDVKASDLLASTVFYKVGHHSSHNATARGKGLELMTKQDELTAFVPVDRKVALSRNPKNSWQMPARALYRALLDKCQGRVCRSDIGWAGDATKAKDKQTEIDFVGMAESKEWTTWKKAQDAATHVDVKDPLFFDYILR
jgi:hypothetical protein